ncbi:MAG: ATP-dependent Clp protease proteolytic subunit [Candidatus Kaiserbacteria bacterium]|nr:ATP-dependent Clp protease proteolytic subunit [Candidatus Kaiserbacteria bacterium]
MADWSEILVEIQNSGGNFDTVRRKHLKFLHKNTGRNVIAYYSGWLQKQGASNLGINDLDKNAFMTTIRGLDRKIGLDLLLHTPGGDIAATESIIDYLITMFDDIRVVVPQLAMSGGTMIACAANEILMGKHSSLGPIDPQFMTSYGHVAAHGVLEEFEQAYKEIKSDQNKVFVWQPIIAKYTPTLIGECKKAMNWAESIVRERLSDRMLSGIEDREERDKKVREIIKEIGDHSVSLSHTRHLSRKRCVEIGLTIGLLEDNQILQDAVLSVHHAMMHTLENTTAVKIVENHNELAYIQKAVIGNR